MLTKAQRELRRGHLGASDTAALFGLDPFKSGVDVWMSKAFELTVDENPSNQNAAIDMGNAFEAPMIEWYSRESGNKVSTNPDDLFGVCKEHPVFAATLDGRLMPKTIRRAVEIKTTSYSADYGESGTDQVPDRVAIQCQQQCLCHDLEGVDVAVLLGRNGLKREIYHVERNDDVIAAIIERGEKFWNDYVVPKIQPPEDAFGLGNLEIIKRVIRVPQTWAEVPDELIDDWDAKRQARLEAEKAEKEALSRVLTPLGDAEGARLTDGRVLEYLPTVRKSLDQRRLKAEAPDVYESFQKESISRTPRIKAGEA